MQNKVDKHSKLSLEAKVSLIASILTILWIFGNLIPSFQKQLKLLSESIGISILTLQLLILLMLIVILTLFFSFRCIFKKQNTLTNIIETKSNDIHQVFKPDKNMITVLLLLKDGSQLYRHQIQSVLNFSHDLSEHCIDELDKQCLVYVVHPDDLLHQLNTARSDLKLELSDVGRKYLIENNLL